MKLIETLVPADFRSNRSPAPAPVLLSARSSRAWAAVSRYSLFVIYLHNVRGFSTDFATLLLSAAALVGICSSPVLGHAHRPVRPGSRHHVRGRRRRRVADPLGARAHRDPGDRRRAAARALRRRRLGTEQHAALAHRPVRTSPAGLRLQLHARRISASGSACSCRRASSISTTPRPFVILYTFNAGVTLLGGLIVLTLCAATADRSKSTARTRQLREEGWREVLRDRRLRQLRAGRGRLDDRRLRLAGGGLQPLRREQPEAAGPRHRCHLLLQHHHHRVLATLGPQSHRGQEPHQGHGHGRRSSGSSSG